MNPKTLFRWHLWLGLITGIFLFLIGLTGAIAVFAEEIDWLVIPPLRARSAPGGQRADGDALMASIRATYPDARISALNLSNRPSFAHSADVQVRRPDGKRQGLRVYLDPATGAINGERVSGGGYTSSAYQFIRQSHVRLLMGFWGRVFVGIIGVTLVLSCITGLWFYRGWIKKMFRLRLTGGWSGRPPWAELHKFIGVWSLLFNLLLGLTGAVLGLENLTNTVDQTWFSPPKAAVPAKPTRDTGAPTSAPAGTPLGVTALLEKAHARFPALTVRSISFSPRSDGPVTVRGGVPDVLVADSHVRSASSITLNGATGEVIRLNDGRQNTGWRLLYWMIDPLHFGYFGGLLTKILWLILGLTPSVLAITGAWMWWRRRAHTNRNASVVPVSVSSPLLRRLPVFATALALIGAYLVVATDLHSWQLTARFVEHWLVKPVSLALAAFPVTLFLCWLLYRLRARPLWLSAAWLLCSGWYVLLAGLFGP